MISHRREKRPHKKKVWAPFSGFAWWYLEDLEKCLLSSYDDG